jgi:hypothetical protein
MLESVAAGVQEDISETGALNNSGQRDFTWSKIACENLSGAVQAFSALDLPDGFPNAKELQSQIASCGPKLPTQDKIDMYNATWKSQPEFRNFSVHAAHELRRAQADRHLITPDDLRRLSAIDHFPKNPAAAWLEYRQMKGETLTKDERALLSGANRFKDNPYAAVLYEKSILGTASHEELGLLNVLSKQEHRSHFDNGGWNLRAGDPKKNLP